MYTTKQDFLKKILNDNNIPYIITLNERYKNHKNSGNFVGWDLSTEKEIIKVDERLRSKVLNCISQKKYNLEVITKENIHNK